MARETVKRNDVTDQTPPDLDRAPVGWVRAAGRVLPVAALVAVGVQFFGLYRAGGPPQVEVFRGIDKVQHLLGFAVPILLVLLIRWWPRPGRPAGITRRFGIVVTLFFLAQALVSELVQGFGLPMRSGDPLDGLADSVGIALGWAGFWLVTRALGRRRG